MTHTTLSIDKKTYEKALKRARSQGLSVSAVARLLLGTYAEGRLEIMPVYTDSPVEIRRLTQEEVTPEIRRQAKRAKRKKRSQLLNIPTDSH